MFVPPRGDEVAQLFEALRYKPQGLGFDSDEVTGFLINLILPASRPRKPNGLRHILSSIA